MLAATLAATALFVTLVLADALDAHALLVTCHDFSPLVGISLEHAKRPLSRIALRGRFCLQRSETGNSIRNLNTDVTLHPLCCQQFLSANKLHRSIHPIPSLSEHAHFAA